MVVAEPVAEAIQAAVAVVVDAAAEEAVAVAEDVVARICKICGRS